MTTIKKLTTGLLSTVFFTAAHQGHAKMDPWLETDERFQKADICDSFVDGDTYRFRHKTCTRLGCDEWDFQVKTFCTTDPAGAKKATIEQIQGNKVFSRTVIDVEMWKSFSGNLLRQAANIAQSYGMMFNLIDVEKLDEGQLKADYQITNRKGRVIESGYWILGQGPAFSVVLEKRATKQGFLREEVSDIQLP